MRNVIQTVPIAKIGRNMVCQFESRRVELRDNLIRLYAESSDTARRQGMAWYPVAQHIVRTWAGRYNLSISAIACIIAALSPQCDWKRNLKGAYRLLDGGIPTGFITRNVAKAQAIHRLAIDNGPEWNALNELYRLFPHGPKVNSFAHNLSGIDTVVTVDTHACQAALADVLSTVTLRWTPYRIFAECYAEAAAIVGHPASTFQAIIWCAWKEKYPRLVKREVRRQW